MIMMQVTDFMKHQSIYTVITIILCTLIFDALQQHDILNMATIYKLWKSRFQHKISLYGIRCYDKYGLKNEKFSISATPGFIAMNYFLMQQLRQKKICNLQNIKEITYDSCNGDELYFQIGPNTLVSLKNNENWKDIYFIMTETTVQRPTKPNVDDEIVKIELKMMSNVHSMETLVKRCEEVYEWYEAEKFYHSQKQLLLFKYICLPSETETPYYKCVTHRSSCSIDNLFFEEKERVMKHVLFFQENKEWYEKHGRPYTLGICTYGPPGCGKTSFEKALAKYLNRHLIVIDFETIKSEEELYFIFFEETLGEYRIPNHQRLYVFPDIDRTTDILYKDQYKTEKVIPIRQSSDSKMKKEKIMEKKASSINLSQILNVFDGIMERSGQIFIMSANHPEKLDPAILRPGRVDCKIHFREFGMDLLKKYITNFFEKEDFLSSRFYSQNVKRLDYKFSPSKLFELCVECNGCSMKLEKLLLKG